MALTFSDFLFSTNAVVKDIIDFFNDSGVSNCMVVNESFVLQGIVTDGDVRRYFAHNNALDVPITKIMHGNPISITWQEYPHASEIMRKKVIKAIPILGNEGQAVALLFLDGQEYFLDTGVFLPVVINAGGKGTRLYPYTKVLPKPLIPVGDKTILEHIIQRFNNQGCSDFISIVNHKKSLIKAYFQEGSFNYSMNFVDEDIPLGTGGGLSLLKGKFSTPFFFSNCDILIDADYRAIAKQHQEEENSVTMVCAEKEVSIPYGVVNVSEDNALTSFSEKPHYHFLTNTGFYLISPEVLEVVPENQSITFPAVMELCKENGLRVGVYKVSEQAWLDMGQIDSLDSMIAVLGNGRTFDNE